MAKSPEPVRIKIDLKRLKVMDTITKRTIKEGRTKNLNIYKISKASKLRVEALVAEDLAIAARFDKPRHVVPTFQEYEPTLDMYPLPPTLIDCIEEMSLHLHLLIQDYDHVSNIEKVYDQEIDADLKMLAKERYNISKNHLEKTIKTIGSKFLKPFHKIVKHYNNTNCLMLIFVEVIKSQMRRAKLPIKRPSSRRLDKFKGLMYKMIKGTQSKKIDHLFLSLKNFKELFTKAYSLSLAKNLESPISSTSCEPSTSRSLVYLDAISE